jgi:DNA-binding NarL/FixJ family response regulator
MQVIERVRDLLESVFNVVFVVANAAALQEGTTHMQPSLAVLDLSIARGELGELVGRLKQASPGTRLIALTVYELPAVAAAALAAGLHGVVLKRFAARDLLHAVDAVQRGDTFVTPELAVHRAHRPEP